MLLSDLGAEVLRIERPGQAETGWDIPEKYNLMNRGRMGQFQPAAEGRVLQL